MSDEVIVFWKVDVCRVNELIYSGLEFLVLTRETRMGTKAKETRSIIITLEET